MDGSTSPLELLRRWAPRLTSRCTDPALAGLILLLITGVIIATTLPLQGNVYASPALTACVIASVVTTALAVALPWRSWHPMAALAMPAALIVSLAVLSMLGGDLGPLGLPYVGMYCLSFVHTGVWLPPRASWWLLIPAVGCYPLLVGQWDRQVALRLAIMALVWVLVGELVAHLQTRQKATEGALRAATRLDALTHLDNRRGMAVRMGNLVGGEIVVMLDLDHFKMVNDTRGHAGGDAVLADFAAVLSLELRHGDYAARYGGEEFVLVLTNTDVASVPAILARLRKSWGVVQPGLTFSSGYARHEAGTSAASSLACADEALYAAKAAGRNRDLLADLRPAHASHEDTDSTLQLHH